MLELSRLKAEASIIIEGLKKRNLKEAAELVNKALELDKSRREIQLKSDNLSAEANGLSKEIGALMKAGKRDEAESIKAKSAELKRTATEFGSELAKVEDELKTILYQIPNVPHEKVPAGAGADDNVAVRTHGEIPVLDDHAMPHWDRIKKYDIIDFDLGVKISGAGFPVYKGKGAKLQRALINFFLDEAEKAGYAEVQPPIVVNETSGYGTGQLPDKDGQMYHVTADSLYLIPTAEVPITNLYRDVILTE